MRLATFLQAASVTAAHRIPNPGEWVQFLRGLPILARLMTDKLLLAGEITTSVIGLLVAISVLIGTLRALIDGKDSAWKSSDVAVAEGRAAGEGWLHRILVAIDIAFNVIVLRGQQDETISTHSWRAQQEGKLWGKVMCWWLNGFQANHGFKAASGDLERAKSRVAQLSKMLGQ